MLVLVSKSQDGVGSVRLIAERVVNPTLADEHVSYPPSDAVFCGGDVVLLPVARQYSVCLYQSKAELREQSKGLKSSVATLFNCRRVLGMSLDISVVLWIACVAVVRMFASILGMRILTFVSPFCVCTSLRLTFYKDGYCTLCGPTSSASSLDLCPSPS